MTDAEWIKLIERHNDGNGNITITNYWWDSYKRRLADGVNPLTLERFRFDGPPTFGYRHEGHPY